MQVKNNHPLHLLALRHVQTLEHHHNLVQRGLGVIFKLILFAIMVLFVMI